MFILYTGSTKQEAETKANTNLGLINEKFQQTCWQNWAVQPMKLTANPELEGVTYYYGFEKPPEPFMNGAVPDLEEEFDSSWLIQES